VSYYVDRWCGELRRSSMTCRRGTLFRPRIPSSAGVPEGRKWATGRGVDSRRSSVAGRRGKKSLHPVEWGLRMGMYSEIVFSAM